MYETEALFHAYTECNFDDFFIKYQHDHKKIPYRFYLQNKLYFHSNDINVCDFIKTSENPNNICNRKETIRQVGYFLIKSEGLPPTELELKPDFIVSSKRYQFYFSNNSNHLNGVFLSFDRCSAYDITGKKITNEFSFIEIEKNINSIDDAIAFATSDINKLLEGILKYSISYMFSKYVFFKDLISCQ